MREVCGTDEIPLTLCLDKLADQKIMEFQSSGIFHTLFSSLPFYRCSEFFDDVIPGGRSANGIECQDLFRLTLPRAYFDLVITQDIFEHMPNPWLAFAEIHKILKPGGKHIFTIPVHETIHSRVRTSVLPNGQLVFAMPPVYHGDPLRPEGALVFTDFGNDVAERLTNIGIPTSEALHTRFYTGNQVANIDNDESYAQYKNVKEKVLTVFKYNSVVFVSEQFRNEQNMLPYRMEFSPATDEFQIHTADTFGTQLNEEFSICSIRGEKIKFNGKTSLMIDITLGDGNSPTDVILMVEVCWGESLIFIFPQKFQLRAKILAKICALLFSTLQKSAAINSLSQYFLLNSEGEDISDKIEGERFVPGLARYYTVIPHLRRYAFVIKKSKTLNSALDVGCGVGYGLGLLNPAKGTGLDISANALEWAKKVIRTPNLSWFRADIQAGPKVERHDTVICFENIEHLDDQIQLMDLLSSSVTPDGQIFVSIPNPSLRGKESNHFHLRDFSFDQAMALFEEYFESVAFFWQNDVEDQDFSKRFFIHEGVNKNADFWIFQCAKPIIKKRSKPKVNIIVAHHNQWPAVMNSITIIKKNTPPTLDWELILIDNASSDEAPDELKSTHGLSIRRNNENIGLYKAWNQGASFSRSEFLVFLDTSVEVQPGWLDSLLEEFGAHRETGITGGKVIRTDGFILNTGLAIGRDLAPISINHKVAADSHAANERITCAALEPYCIAVRRKDFLKYGLFDEQFPEFSAFDLCLQYRRAGQKSVYCPNCVVRQTDTATSAYKDIDIRDSGFELAGFTRLLQRNVDQLIQDDFAYSGSLNFPNSLGTKLNFAINICTPSRGHRGWGDTYYAECLAKYLVRAGHKCIIQYRNEWNRDNYNIDVVIHLKGLEKYYPKPWHINLMWMLNHPDRHTKKELERYDAILVASSAHADTLAAGLSTLVKPLLQVTDPEHFSPIGDITPEYDLIFVGNNHGIGRLPMRKIISDLLPTKHKLAVWGQGWAGILPPGCWKGEFLEWEKLPEAYCNARIVLNDHQPEMAKNGFINNRTFDALSCGTLVVSDPVLGMDDIIGVPQCGDAASLQRAIDNFLCDPQSAHHLATSLRQNVIDKRTFQHAVEEIESSINMLLANNRIYSRISSLKPPHTICVPR